MKWTYYCINLNHTLKTFERSYFEWLWKTQLYGRQL